ncbi:MAG: ATP-binding protein [Desulfobacteraceae bacterium]|jgi:PAS domain S-box-containing protein|nr:ATP-binding protein [Desulfobacteraceae bacterium]
MSESAPLYNSRVTKIYIQYLQKYHPEIDSNTILEQTGIAAWELEDPSHWFTQEQQDRLHDILVSRTGNPNIARDAGRYATSSEGLGATKQYILGLMNPTAIFMLIGKVYPLLSRAAEVRSKKIGPNSMEIVSVPKPGVNEKPYQCANRMGIFESTAKFFTDTFANIEHPSCLHNGDDSCRYIINWNKSPKNLWQRIRNFVLFLNIVALIALWFTVSFSNWVNIALICAFLTVLLFYYSKHLETKALIKTIEIQTESAQDSIYESDMRYNNAMLIQEIGQATSSILDIGKLLETVAGLMEKRLEFDRGMIMMVDKKKATLRYAAGYGQKQGEEETFKKTEFRLDNPKSQGLFVVAIRDQRPFLIDNISQIEQTFSKRSLEMARKYGGRALICVPIIYEKESLGILAVDNSKSRRPLRQSDMSLLMGVASQLAITIANAVSFGQLHSSEKKYRELVENANSIILRLDKNGNIIFFNEFAQRLLGYSEEEILGKNAGRIILPPSGLNRLSFDELSVSLQKDPERPVVSENQTETRSGEKVWIAWTYKPIFDDTGRFTEILCIGNDITDLKWASQEKEELKTQLQRAQKMEAIGTLAGGVAHDLNNILSGIVSYPELLLMDLKEDSPLRKPILTIQKSGEKAAAIVQDLLTLARRGVETTEVVNLNSIVSEYLYSPEHARLELNHPNIRIEQNLDQNLLNILGSPVHLSKSVMNLVSNAAEAMLDGGNVVITTENRHMDKVKNGFDEIDKGDYAALVIKDTGIGISPEDMERIFEPFYTKKTMGRSGTGLGMAVVWGAVKDHRGYIDIQSTEGKGTEITLYFPVTRRVFSQEAELVSIQDFMGKGESILVVDDILEQRQIATEMLEKLGYAVTNLPSGEEAVKYLSKHTTDLLVLDMIMEPGIDGLETYKKILKIHPGQKSIIASGYSESARVKEAQLLGAGTYVKKPYLLEKIGRAIRAELDR